MEDSSGERPLCQCGCGEPAPLAKRTWPAKGWVKGQPLRYVNGHNRRRTPHDYIEEDRGHTTPCWVWQRAISNVGYAMTRKNGRTCTAHRWFYQQRFGPIPDGLELDHLCRVRECVNPEHLEPVTSQVNRQRGANAKLTPAMIRQIRASPLSGRQLEKTMGVSYRTINDVRNGRRWSNIV